MLFAYPFLSAKTTAQISTGLSSVSEFACVVLLLYTIAMITVTFDTHTFIKRLEQAEFTEAQAEALVEALQQSQQEQQHTLASKMDILRLEGKFTLLQWMLTFNLAFTMAILWKMFTVSVG